MLAGVSTVARSFGRKGACVAVVLTLAAGLAAAAQTPSVDADAVDASVGGVAVRLTAPAGQELGATALEPIYLLHDVSGDGVQALAVYLAPETAKFFERRGQTLPAQGLSSTLIITERELESRHVDEHSLRDVLVDELAQQRQLQAFLATARFGAQRVRVSLPETRLLTVEDFLILQGNERLLPQSGRRISYCVEAFIALRNRPVLASSCLTKPEVTSQDMYVLETSVGTWARRLLVDNPSSRAPAPKPTKKDGKDGKDGAFQPAADTRPDPAAKSVALMNLRNAADHRRRDVLVAAALLSAQLPAEMRTRLDKSNERFSRKVGAVCGKAPDAALGYQCELIAYDRRLRALEQCTAASVTPALQAESVEPVAGQLPNT